MKRYALIFTLILLCTSTLFAQRALREGVEALRQKNYSDAISLLRDTIKTTPNNQKAYLYLCFAYMAIEDYTLAEGILLAGVEVPGPDTSELYYHLGNLMFRRGEWAFAANYYSRSLGLQENYTASLLNRANALVEEGSSLERGVELGQAWDKFRLAILDYSAFLSLDTATPKKNEINQMIALLKSKEQNLLDLQKAKDLAALNEKGQSETGQDPALLEALDRQASLLEGISETNSDIAANLALNQEGPAGSNVNAENAQINASNVVINGGGIGGDPLGAGGSGAAGAGGSGAAGAGGSGAAGAGGSGAAGASSLNRGSGATTRPSAGVGNSTGSRGEAGSEATRGRSTGTSGGSGSPPSSNTASTNAARAQLEREAQNMQNLLNNLTNNLKEDSLLLNQRSAIQVKALENEEISIDE